MKNFLAVLFIVFYSSVIAQERVTITDPDLEFSYMLPKDWCYKDDPLYHYIAPENCDSDGILPISITYFNYSCPDIEVCLDGKVNGELKSELDDFELAEKGVDTIDGTESRWAIFTYTKGNETVKEAIYIFIRLGQMFEVRWRFPVGTFELYQAETRALIESFEVKPKD